MKARQAKKIMMAGAASEAGKPPAITKKKIKERMAKMTTMSSICQNKQGMKLILRNHTTQKKIQPKFRHTACS